jgi:dihydrofolate synthase/folylpolyglutamate synthase
VVGPQQDSALEVIKAKAAKIGAPLLIHGQDWQVWEENGRMAYLDKKGLLDLPLPNLIGAHQVQNAGAAIAALRALGKSDAACEAAITTAKWPARLQKLHHGPLTVAAGQAELWLDGGHNPAAGQALCEALGRLPTRATYLICGMLKTKDITGYLAPLATIAEKLFAVSIPDEMATLSAAETVSAARSIDMPAEASANVADAIAAITADDPTARILICGSLYLAGNVLRENG